MFIGTVIRLAVRQEIFVSSRRGVHIEKLNCFLGLFSLLRFLEWTSHATPGCIQQSQLQYPVWPFTLFKYDRIGKSVISQRIEVVNWRPIVVLSSLFGSSLFTSLIMADKNEFTSGFSLQWATPTMIGDCFCDKIGFLRERSADSLTECTITQRGIHSACSELLKNRTPSQLR
jgi:hypothetical protein